MDLVAAHPGIKWFVLDGSTINTVDVTSAEILESLPEDLAARGIRFGLANLHRDVRNKLKSAGALERIGTDSIFPTFNTASEAFLSLSRTRDREDTIELEASNRRSTGL